MLILAILKQEDTYVYDIVKKIKNFSNNSFQISQNTIYASTYKLEKDNYISEYTKLVGRKRTRVYYHLEESGLAYFDEQLTSYLNAVSSVRDILKSLEIIKD